MAWSVGSKFLLDVSQIDVLYWNGFTLADKHTIVFSFIFVLFIPNSFSTGGGACCCCCCFRLFHFVITHCVLSFWQPSRLLSMTLQPNISWNSMEWGMLLCVFVRIFKFQPKHPNFRMENLLICLVGSVFFSSVAASSLHSNYLVFALSTYSPFLLLEKRFLIPTLFSFWVVHLFFLFSVFSPIQRETFAYSFILYILSQCRKKSFHFSVFTFFFSFVTFRLPQ